MAPLRFTVTPNPPPEGEPSVADAYRMGGLAEMEQYNPEGAFAAPPEPTAYDAAQAAQQRMQRSVMQRTPRAGPAMGDTFMQGAEDTVGGIVQPIIEAPGKTMAPNPYAAGSEEADFFEDQRGRNAIKWAGDMATDMIGTGTVFRPPAGAGQVLGSGAIRPRRKAPVMGDTAVVDDVNPRAVIGGNAPPIEVPPPTGSMNPLHNVDVTFRGKQPKEFTADDWQAFGKHYGVKNIGPLSPLETFKDIHGKEFTIPGGLGGTWTYLDTLHMKANPINPANVDRTLHAEMQRKLGRTMTPQQLTDADVWNGLIFGMTSPNNPLFPNQVTASRLRLRTPEMLDDLASSIPWKAGEEVTKQQRKLANDAIASRFGLDAAGKGGLGTRGTADYTRIAEMAQMFKENPQFFRKQANESWGEAVERISSQLPGLSMKTGSFGTVWQDPANAAISAIDRHMARELDKVGGLFTPAEREVWQARSVNLWNKRELKRVASEEAKNAKKGVIKDVSPADLATDFDDMVAKSGSDGFIGEMLLAHVGDAKTPKFRLKGGEINPAIPAHLQNAQWAREPETVFKMGRAYKQALDVNQKVADENALNLFMSQWMEWDRIRNRFEPHENMFPGLSKLPAMSVEQMRDVDRAHRQTGHKTYGKNPEGTLKPTRPLQGLPSSMGYLGMGGLAAGLGNELLKPGGEDERVW